MAAVGAELTGSWLLSSGVISLFIILLLLIFLTALCSDCNKHSFDLQDPKADKTPSALIRVVTLEEARENPMIGEIQKDEKGFHPKEDSAVAFRPSKIQIQRDPETLTGSHGQEETSVSFTPWRSHLMAPQSKDVNGSSPSDSAHIYSTVGRVWSSSSDTPPQPANHSPVQPLDGSREEEEVAARSAASTAERSSVYAGVSKKLHLTDPPVHTPERKGEESSPPPPHRRAEVEG